MELRHALTSSVGIQVGQRKAGVLGTLSTYLRGWPLYLHLFLLIGIGKLPGKCHSGSLGDAHVC
jgi:hypothetical protein